MLFFYSNSKESQKRNLKIIKKNMNSNLFYSTVYKKHSTSTYLCFYFYYNTKFHCFKLSMEA